jgi:hypothetical protein
LSDIFTASSFGVRVRGWSRPAPLRFFYSGCAIAELGVGADIWQGSYNTEHVNGGLPLIFDPEGMK